MNNILSSVVYAQNAGIECSPAQMKSGQCSLNVNELLQIKDGQSSDAEELVKDGFYGATFFIGTVVTVALVASSLMLIMAGANEKMQDRGKKGIQFSIYGLLLVLFSYTIIRLIQYLAKGA